MEKEGSESRRGGGEEGGNGGGYRYWVRNHNNNNNNNNNNNVINPQPPPPKKLDNNNNQSSSPLILGSLWNQAGTWEEKNLNIWANLRIKELLVSVSSLEFSGGGAAEIYEVSKCVGDAYLVTVRNKKRVGYTYELTLRVKGEWLVGEGKKKVKGYIDIPEFSFGEVNELEFEVRLSEDKDLTHGDKMKIREDMKKFLQPVREKLLQFEDELKDK